MADKGIDLRALGVWTCPHCGGTEHIPASLPMEKQIAAALSHYADNHPDALDDLGTDAGDDATGTGEAS